MRPQTTTFRLEDGCYDSASINRQLDHMMGYIDNPNGCYDLVLREHRNRRSDHQQGWYWLTLTALAQETGDSAESHHKWFKREFLGRVERCGKHRFLVVPSTQKLTRKEFSEYLERVCAEILEMFPEFEFPPTNDDT